MKTLAVNVGSSSLKFQVFSMPEEEILLSGNFEKIGIEGSFYNIVCNGEKIKKEAEIKDHKKAVEILNEELTKYGHTDIETIGHRVVHGGTLYSESVIIDDKVISDIEKLVELAPLHNPANLVGIKVFKEYFPNSKMVAVFDTAFHQTIRENLFMYSVPYEWYEKYGIRKYGFHGISYQYITERAKEKFGENKKLIVCHLGNGSSISAIEDGKCVDTTMGFTPLSGIPMGTRCGDVDPAVIPFVMKKENKTIDEVMQDLNKNSGFYGTSGASSDSRELERLIGEGDKRARLAQDLFINKAVMYISFFNTLLNGADAILFTAGIGENSAAVRKEICDGLKALGIKLNDEKNSQRGIETLISSEDSKIEAYIMPTNEELMIVRNAYNLAK